MQYICHNAACSECGKPDSVGEETFVLRGSRIVGKHAACPVCGQEREFVTASQEIPLSQKNFHIGQYTNASPEERRAMLKKRSHEHYEKEVRPVKEEKVRKAVEAFREAGK